MDQVRTFACQLVEVTGGEPLAQPAALTLIERLCEEGFEVLIETGGFVTTEGVDPRAGIILDVKCPGSGEAERNHWPNLERLRPAQDEVKFVIADRADWNYAIAVIQRYGLSERTRAMLISPVWNALDLKEVAEWVSDSGLDVRLQLQLHKYIWGPEERGV
jgi:7-carboxy-7-deazaguanine synthase